MIRWYLLALTVLILDQGSKYWVVQTLEFGRPVEFTSFFNFTLLYNKGAAWSFLSDAGGWQIWFFSGIATAVSIALIVWIARLPKHQWWLACALALVLGGAVGNLYDRVVLGHVVDFIVFHYERYYFPAFNIADSGITLGAMMLIWDAFRGEQEA